MQFWHIRKLQAILLSYVEHFSILAAYVRMHKLLLLAFSSNLDS